MPAGTRDQPPAQPNVRVYTLGTFKVLVGEKAVEDHAWRRKTARQLFKVLLTRPGRRMTRDEVVELFWPESDPDAAASNLRSTLYAMRQALDGSRSSLQVVQGDHGSVWLGSDAQLWTDAAVFEAKVTEAWRSADPLPLLEEASALYSGDYLPDDLYEDWAGERRDALRRTWTELQFGLAQALEARSADVNAALQPLERLLRADPCDERAAQEEMKLLTRHGRRAEALRVYQRLLQSLREELDVEPSAETVEIHRQISAGETVATAPIPPSFFRCTYPFPAPSELVGRDAELAALSSVLAAGRTAGRIALIAAPAGTGKSALLGEIVRRAQAQGVLCLAGGCYEERGAVPLGPFHDALLDYLLAQSPEHLHAQFGASLEDLSQLIPELRYHVGLTSPAAGLAPVDRMRAFGAIHACLRGLAKGGPVLACLEDLHAADEATLQLLHYLARQTRRLPIVFVGTYRDDETSPDAPLAQVIAAILRERLAQRVDLAPLTRTAADRLVTNLLEGEPSESMCSSLYDTTGGNPLFLEQLLLALDEQGQIERRAGVWYVQGELHGTPRIVREVIAQRLLRLDPECREILAIASVLGMSFEHKILLGAVEPLDEAALLRHVDRAIKSQVLQDIPDGYGFRHTLVRDAVYWNLTRPHRMLLHSRVGALLERIHGERATDHASELARHFNEGGESAEVRAKALHYTLVAGRRANALASNRDALTYFRRALELIAELGPQIDPAPKLEALEGRGYAERELGQLDAAMDTFRSVLDAAEDPIQRARVRGEIASALLHNDPALALQETGAALLELSASDPRREAESARIRIQSFEAMCWFLAGQYSRVQQLGEEMAESAAQLGDPPLLFRANSVVSWAHIGTGNVERALELTAATMTAALQSRNRADIASAHVNLAIEMYLCGRFALARGHIDQAIALYGAAAGDLWLGNTHQLRGRGLLAEGDLVGARTEANTAFKLVAEHYLRWAAESLDLLGTVHRLFGQSDLAIENLSRALAMQRRLGHAAGMVETLVGLGLIRIERADWENARDHLTEAMEIANTIDDCLATVTAARELGLLYLAMNDLPKATAHLERARSTAERVALATIEWAPTLAAVAQLHAASGDLDRGSTEIESALERPLTMEASIRAHLAAAQIYSQLTTETSASQAHTHADIALELAERFGAPHLVNLAFQQVASLQQNVTC